MNTGCNVDMVADMVVMIDGAARVEDHVGANGATGIDHDAGKDDGAWAQGDIGRKDGPWVTNGGKAIALRLQGTIETPTHLIVANGDHQRVVGDGCKLRKRPQDWQPQAHLAGKGRIIIQIAKGLAAAACLPGLLQGVGHDLGMTAGAENENIHRLALTLHKFLGGHLTSFTNAFTLKNLA